MGNASSAFGRGSGGEIKTVLDSSPPAVPTKLDLERASSEPNSLKSGWWALQRDRKVPAAVSLDMYGKEY